MRRALGARDLVEHVVLARGLVHGQALHFLQRGHITRLLTFRAGRLMHQVERTSLLRSSLGRAHARLVKALAAFAGEAPPGDLLWDLLHAQQLRQFLKHVDAAKRAAALTAAVRRVEDEEKEVASGALKPNCSALLMPRSNATQVITFENT